MRRLAAFVVLLSFAAAAQETFPIALTELQAEGIDESSVRVISDRLRTELFKTGEFMVVERGQMEEILKEQGFQQSGCTSDACVVEVGQILGVKGMIAGSVGKLGGLFTLNVRLIDVGSASITQTVNVDCTCPIEEVLTKSTPEIARKLAEAVTGKTIASADDTERGRDAVRRDGEKGKRKHRLWPKFVFGGLAVASAVGGLAMNGQVDDAVDRMVQTEDDYHRVVDESADPGDPYDEFAGMYEEAWKDASETATLRNVMYGAAGVFTVAFGVSFAF